MSRGGRREVGLLRGVDSPGLFFVQLNLANAEAALRKTPFVFYTSHLVRQHSCLQWSRQHVLQCASQAPAVSSGAFMMQADTKLIDDMCDAQRLVRLLLLSDQCARTCDLLNTEKLPTV